MEHLFWIVYALLNLIAFSAMGLDKRLARAGRRRIRERTLFLWAVLLGAVGGTAGMFVFRHKTRHTSFRIFFPLLAVLQTAGLVFLAVRGILPV